MQKQQLNKDMKVYYTFVYMGVYVCVCERDSVLKVLEI